MAMSENGLYPVYPQWNSHLVRDNDQPNHWVFRGTLTYFQTNPHPATACDILLDIIQHELSACAPLRRPEEDDEEAASSGGKGTVIFLLGLVCLALKILPKDRNLSFWVGQWWHIEQWIRFLVRITFRSTSSFGRSPQHQPWDWNVCCCNDVAWHSAVTFV